MKTLKRSAIGSGFRLNDREIAEQRENRLRKVTYHGGTPQFRKRVAKRRKANRIAKQSRKSNR